MRNDPGLVAILAYDGLCTFEFGIAVEIFGLALVIYFVLAQTINFAMRRLEQRLARGRMRGGLS